MERDDDPWRRLREREEQENAENNPEESSVGKKRHDLDAPSIKIGGSGISSEKLLQLLSQVDPLIEQISNLYQMYANGVEKKPPTERRKFLEGIMMQILAAPKPTPSLQFRCQTTSIQFQTHKDRWDRMLKGLEDGKLKRGVGIRKQ